MEGIKKLLRVANDTSIEAAKKCFEEAHKIPSEKNGIRTLEFLCFLTGWFSQYTYNYNKLSYQQDAAVRRSNPSYIADPCDKISCVVQWTSDLAFFAAYNTDDFGAEYAKFHDGYVKGSTPGVEWVEDQATRLELGMSRDITDCGYEREGFARGRSAFNAALPVYDGDQGTFATDEAYCKWLDSKNERPVGDLMAEIEETGQQLVRPNMVNHPPHYTQGTIECISVIEDWKLNFHTGSALRYICRLDHKDDPIENLRKAVWYLEREIKRRESFQTKKTTS